MQSLEAAITATANPWPLRRERAIELASRYPHAAEMLRLYQALIPVQERAYLEALSNNLPPPVGEGRVGAVAALAAERVAPSIVDVTVSAGPPRLRDGVITVFSTANLVAMIQRWLEFPSPSGGGQGESLNPFETYLARASASPLLEASSSSTLKSLSPHKSHSSQESPSPSGGGSGWGQDGGSSCPTCGGFPQLSYFAVSGEALVTGPRYLVCSRCANNWIFSRMTCASCGETEGAKLPIFQEHEQFPHVRVDGCRTCRKYLLTFDLRRDERAVPIVDELAALPLDLFAVDQGLTKITPNLLGN